MKEEVVRFGERRELVGIRTDRAETEGGGDRTGVVLLNAGILHRVGPNRLYVRIARCLAGEGCAVLRFDFSGMGDSARGDDRSPFGERVVRETQQAMEYLSAASGRDRFLLVGMCSGADIAFQVASKDSRVVGVALVNAQSYRIETSPEVVAYISERNAAAYYWRTARRSYRSWLRVLRGRADYWSALRGIARQLRGRWSRPEVRSAAEDVTADFRRLIDRGVRLLVVYSKGDPGLGYFRLLAGRGVRGWTRSERFKTTIIPRADHMITPIESQTRVLEAVREFAREALPSVR